MRKLFISAVLGMAAMAGCAKDKDKDKAGEAKEDLAEMSLDEVEKGIAANQLTVFDCNGDSTRKKFGVVPGAVMIADEETFAASELPADKTRKLVFYCSGPG